MARYKVTDTKEAREEFLEQEEVFQKVKVGLYATAIGSVIIVCPGTMKIALWALALGYSAVVKHRETSLFCELVSDAIYGIFKKFQNIKDDLAEYKTNFLEESTPSMSEEEMRAAYEAAEEKKWRDYAETRRILDEMKAKHESSYQSKEQKAAENALYSMTAKQKSTDAYATEEFLRRVNAIQNEGYQTTKNNEGRHL